MKVSGFTFIRNGIQLDYPFREAIRSILPLVDEMVVAVGNSADETRSAVEALDPKIKIIDTIWDDSLRQGGKVLALETDKAKAACSIDSTWLIYIQGDESFHEQDYPEIRSAMETYANNSDVDGLLFQYKHFYGSYDYLAISNQWYRKEVRIIKNNPEIHSFRDAQGFRKLNDQKLDVVELSASVHHYGWVRDPRAMQKKQHEFHRLWHDDEWLDKNIAKSDEFDYSGIDVLQKFKGTHPSVMNDRIDRLNWKFDHDLSKNKLKFKDRLKGISESLFGIRPGEFKNYRIIFRQSK